MTLLNQKNNYIADKERENEDLTEQIETLNRTIKRLEDDDKVKF